MRVYVWIEDGDVIGVGPTPDEAKDHALASFKAMRKSFADYGLELPEPTLEGLAGFAAEVSVATDGDPDVAIEAVRKAVTF